MREGGSHHTSAIKVVVKHIPACFFIFEADQLKFEDGIKLDFDDVLIRPKRSTLSSRSGVDIEKVYNYLHASVQEVVVPIVAANMDTVGTMAMAEKLEPEGMQTCLHKYYSVDELVGFFTRKPRLGTFFTIGIKEEDVEKLKLTHIVLGSISMVIFVLTFIPIPFSEI